MILETRIHILTPKNTLFLIHISLTPVHSREEAKEIFNIRCKKFIQKYGIIKATGNLTSNKATVTTWQRNNTRLAR